MSVQLALLAHGAAFNIFVHEICETWPPRFKGDELVSFEITGVSGSLMVVATGKDGAMEEVLQGNVDTAFVSQNMVIVLPVRETGPEGSRDVLQ